MEDESISVVNYAPSFARGLNLLLVDNNTTSLMYLSSLLEKYAFNVTPTDELSVAMSMICNPESQFKLVMVKLKMPGIDVLSFLDLLHEKDIPVFFISSGESDDVILKALVKGSCYFLEEPILFKDLKYLWQHAYHSKHRSAKEDQYASKLKHNQITRGYGSPSASTVFPSPLGSPSYPEQEEHQHASMNQSTDEFGGGLPASTTAPLNASLEQDQFVMNYAETQESDIHNVQMALGNSSIAYEFPITGLASLNFGTTVGNSLPDASSTFQNQFEAEYERIKKKLEEDCDSENFGNGVNPDLLEEYTNMLLRLIEN